MKLLPTYAKTDAGLIVRDGYFNPSTGIRYAVLEGQADKGGEPEIQWVTVWSVVAYINAGDEPMAYLSVDYPTVDDALTELDRIAALIEGKDEPRWGIGIDLASGPDSAVEVVIDRVTGKIVSVKDAVTPAQGWVKGPPPKDGQWYAAIDYDGDPTVVRHDPEPNDATPWHTATQFRYANDPTHHLPTPIVAPKES